MRSILGIIGLSLSLTAEAEVLKGSVMNAKVIKFEMEPKATEVRIEGYSEKLGKQVIGTIFAADRSFHLLQTAFIADAVVDLHMDASGLVSRVEVERK